MQTNTHFTSIWRIIIYESRLKNYAKKNSVLLLIFLEPHFADAEQKRRVVFALGNFNYYSQGKNNRMETPFGLKNSIVLLFCISHRPRHPLGYYPYNIRYRI